MIKKLRLSAFYEGLAAFFISCTILFAASVYFNQFSYAVSEDAISAGFISKVAVIGNYPIISDSRLFLLPMQAVLTMVLSSFPLIHNQEFAAQLLTILFTGGISTILLITARRSSVHPILRWLLLFVFISHPLTIKAVLVGSGVPTLVFFVLIVFINLHDWYMNHHWLSLVWIGLGCSLAMLTQFNSIFFFVLPIIFAVAIAFRIHTENYYFAENALYIIITPVVYIFLVRMFFSEIFFDSWFYFIRYELINGFLFGSFPPTSGFLDAGVVQTFFRLCQMMWESYPPFLVISVLVVGLSIFSKKIFPFLFTASIWVSLLLLQLNILPGMNSALSILFFSIVSLTILLLITQFSGESRIKKVLFASMCGLMALVNFLLFIPLEQLKEVGNFNLAPQVNQLNAEIQGTQDARIVAFKIKNLEIQDIYLADSASLDVPFVMNDAVRFINPLDPAYSTLTAQTGSFEGYVLLNADNLSELMTRLDLDGESRSIEFTFQSGDHVLMEVRQE